MWTVTLHNVRNKGSNSNHLHISVFLSIWEGENDGRLGNGEGAETATILGWDRSGGGVAGSMASTSATGGEAQLAPNGAYFMLDGNLSVWVIQNHNREVSLVRTSASYLGLIQTKDIVD